MESPRDHKLSAQVPSARLAHRVRPPRPLTLSGKEYRKSGQLVINASITGLLGMSGDSLNFAYCSSKIWACTYGVGLRSILKSENIGVTVL